MVQRTTARRRMASARPDYTKLYILIAAIAVVAVGVFLFILLYAPKATATQGTMPFSYEGKGLVIRKEKLYKAENYGKTSFIAQEGEVVTSGTAIADVYSWDYNASDVAQLNVIQDTIMDYQQKYLVDETLQKELSSKNEQINAKAKEISDVVAGNATGDLIKLEKELKQLMNERREFLNDAVNEDEQLKTFKDQEKDLETRINDWKQTILAESDGVVSFYFDGLETLLTPDNINKLTVGNINDIFAGKSIAGVSRSTETTASEPSGTSRPLYRLVEQNLWYVVFVADKSIPEFENKSNSFDVVFSAGDTKTYTGTVMGGTEDSGKHIYYLQFKDPIDDMVMARKVTLNISATFTGTQVPSSAVKLVDGKLGVYMDENGKKVFEQVSVKTIADDKAIVVPSDISSPLKAGSTVYA